MFDRHQTIYVFGAYELDMPCYQLRRSGTPLALEPKVFDVLAYLVHHGNRLVTKDELFDHFWPGIYVGDAAVVRCIVAARKAVGDRGHTQQIIQTVRRRGYRFVAPVTRTVPADPGRPLLISTHDDRKPRGQAA